MRNLTRVGEGDEAKRARETKGWRRLDPGRPLTANERAILTGLAESARPEDRAAMLCQTERATVLGECADDCGSLLLTTDAACEPAQVVLTAEQLEPKDKPTRCLSSLLLYSREGYVWYLEAYSTTGDDLNGLPPHDQLTYLGG